MPKAYNIGCLKKLYLFRYLIVGQFEMDIKENI